MGLHYQHLEASASAGSSRIEVSIRAGLSEVKLMRRFISNLYTQVLGDEDLASRLVVASHELLENAIKCAIDEVTTLRVEVREEGALRHISVSTRNRSCPADIAVLRSMLDEMGAHADAFEHYLELMRESARRATGSGLGLARVRAEAEMEIEGQIDADDYVTILAHGTIARAA